VVLNSAAAIAAGAGPAWRAFRIISSVASSGPIAARWMGTCGWNTGITEAPASAAASQLSSRSPGARVAGKSSGGSRGSSGSTAGAPDCPSGSGVCRRRSASVASSAAPAASSPSLAASSPAQGVRRRRQT
jgi:hypothetical protein